jgi:hypothetical protein
MQCFYYDDSAEIHFVMMCLWQDTTLFVKKGAQLDFEGNKKKRQERRGESREKKVKQRETVTIENQDKQ